MQIAFDFFIPFPYVFMAFMAVSLTFHPVIRKLPRPDRWQKANTTQ